MKKSFFSYPFFLISGFFIFLLIYGLLSFHSQSKTYVSLIEKASSQELKQLTSALDKKGISFQLDAQRKEIYVHKDRFLEAQKILKETSERKKESSSKSLGLFSKPYFGLVSSYMQRVKYQKVLQRELSQAINKLAVVKSSQVMLSLPQRKSMWAHPSSEVSASILLEFQPGSHIRKEHIKSLTLLVSGAVEHLKPEKVTVLDSQGHILSSQDSEALALLNTQLKKIKETSSSSHLKRTTATDSFPKESSFFGISGFLSLGFLLGAFGFLMGFIWHRRRVSVSLRSVERVLPRTVEELEELEEGQWEDFKTKAAKEKESIGQEMSDL